MCPSALDIPAGTNLEASRAARTEFDSSPLDGVDGRAHLQVPPLRYGMTNKKGGMKNGKGRVTNRKGGMTNRNAT